MISIYNCRTKIDRYFDCYSDTRLGIDLADAKQEEQEIKKFRNSAERLLASGITQMALHKIIAELVPPSPMVITEDYRIILPAYNDVEVTMTNLPKSLYFLFLRYRNGIILKTLPDYYKELYNIYIQLSPNVKEDKARIAITELVNPLNNRAYENISRANRAFKDCLDEYRAKHYIIEGTKGEIYSISIDRNLIEWQEE